MPYRRTQFLAGRYYHVYNRGNNRQPIFFNAENYRYFLRQVGRHLCPCADVVAYCLMPNHYHLLLHLKKDDLSQAMQSFTTSYVQAINREQDRVGHLFQGPFQAILVDTDQYLVHLSRYIHLNPVRARLVQMAHDWVHSSYSVYIGLRQSVLLRPHTVLSYFVSANGYRTFVEKYAESDSAWVQCFLPS